MTRFADQTWKDAAELPEDWIAILPVGAVEAHGPHLPLRTDGIIAEAMAREGAAELGRRELPACVLPTLDYAAAPFAEGFPGTISVAPEAVAELIASIAVSVTEQGAAGLVLASAHLDPMHLRSLYEAVEMAAEAGAAVVFPDITRKPWALRLTDEFRTGACHAGQYESSVVMAESPDLVRDDVRATLEPFMTSLSEAIRDGLDSFEAAGGEDAYFGDPAKATAEEGRETIGVLGTILADAVDAVFEAVDEDFDEDPGPVDLTGRGAVVTGAGRGIGADVARTLAAAGASVVLGARSVDQLEAVAAEIREAGGTAHAVRCDVADPDSVAAFVEAANEALDSVDIVVNNAGIGHSVPLHKETLEGWQRVMAINATGTFLLTQAFFGTMLKRGWGRVINVASVAGLEGARYTSTYAASKHAVLGLTKSAAAEGEGKGVTVNAICPAYVDTPMTTATVENVRARTGMSDEEALRAVLDSADQERLVTVEEISEIVLDLCADEAADVNGEAIVLDGND